MIQKKVIIRVDGNKNIGLGHIYRGIALADMLNNNFIIEFVSKPDSITSPIEAAKYKFILLPNNISILQEPEWLKNHYSQNNTLVLDGYSFGQNYQEKLKQSGFKLVFIDDLALGIQKADLVINHSPGIRHSDYITEKYTKLALGLEFALLRNSFVQFERSKIKPPNEIKNIFISFGGADPKGFSFQVSKEILNIKNIETINIVLGAAYQEEILYSLDDKRIKIHKNLSEHEIFTLMKRNDLGIVPASTTCLELASLGIPMFLGYYVENQVGIYNGFVNSKAVCAIGDFNKYKFKNLSKEISKINNIEILEIFQQKLLRLFRNYSKNNIINKFKTLC